MRNLLMYVEEEVERWKDVVGRHSDVFASGRLD